MATLSLLKWGYFAPPFLGACLVIAFAARYSLDEAKGYETKARLRERRAGSEASATSLPTNPRSSGLP